VSEGPTLAARLDGETIEFMYRHQRTALIDMIRDSWLPPHVMKMVFETCRADGGMIIHISRLCMSHPNAEVRAIAAVELCAFYPIAQLNRYLWC